MLLIIACIVVAVTAAPSTHVFNYGQDGNNNFHANFQNMALIFGLPEKLHEFVLALFGRETKKSGDDLVAQNIADAQLMDTFVEPNTAYGVIISSERKKIAETYDADLIGSRRRSETDLEPQVEMKLIGASEKCGSGQIRDPVTLICKFTSNLTPEKLPKVNPV